MFFEKGEGKTFRITNRSLIPSNLFVVLNRNILDNIANYVH
jgi:hypothetical protein